MKLRVWLAAASLVLTSTSTAMASSEIEGIDLPDELPTPTTSQLDRSVQRWTTNHIDRSVHQWSVEGSVKPMVEESSAGGETTLTLLSDVLFEFGSAQVEDSAAAAIEAQLDKIPPGATVEVTGHTDSVGGRSVNQQLSEERAKAVAAIITSARSDLAVETSGRGSSDPVAENTVGGQDNPAGRMLNRRVEVTFGN